MIFSIVVKNAIESRILIATTIEITPTIEKKKFSILATDAFKIISILAYDAFKNHIKH